MRIRQAAGFPDEDGNNAVLINHKISQTEITMRRAQLSSRRPVALKPTQCAIQHRASIPHLVSMKFEIGNRIYALPTCTKFQRIVQGSQNTTALRRERMASGSERFFLDNTLGYGGTADKRSDDEGPPDFDVLRRKEKLRGGNACRIGKLQARDLLFHFFLANPVIGIATEDHLPLDAFFFYRENPRLAGVPARRQRHRYDIRSVTRAL